MKVEIMLTCAFNAVGIVAARYTVVEAAPANAGEPFDAFGSLSIELSSFPDYAGETTSFLGPCLCVTRSDVSGVR